MPIQDDRCADGLPGLHCRRSILIPRSQFHNRIPCEQRKRGTIQSRESGSGTKKSRLVMPKLETCWRTFRRPGEFSANSREILVAAVTATPIRLFLAGPRFPEAKPPVAPFSESLPDLEFQQRFMDIPVRGNRRITNEQFAWIVVGWLLRESPQTATVEWFATAVA